MISGRNWPHDINYIVSVREPPSGDKSPVFVGYVPDIK
jgi:hypothetical protein